MTRIVIPDTFLYATIADTNNLYTSIILSGVKNTLGPSLLWYIVGFNWYIMSLVNVFIIYWIAIYLEKLARIYSLSKAAAQWAVLLFFFVPATLYYTVGALKELPVALLLLVTVYHYSTKSYGIALFAALLLVLFRYQLAIILIFVTALGMFRNNRLRWALWGLLFAAAIYPALSDIKLLTNETTLIYRELHGTAGSLGEQVENVRNNVYIASIIGVLLRAAQSLLEPVIAFTGQPTFYEDESLSVFVMVQFITIIALLPYVRLFIVKLVSVLRDGSRVSADVSSLYALLLSSLILVGGFSFIHHRYLYPFFPLLIVASLIPLKRVK